MQTSLSQEYGNAKLNELLGTGEESIARKICLGAFGYDWEFNVKNLVDAAYSTSFATLVQAITSSREFLTVDPVTHKPKYEYRASWIINPGCDFERYDVYLACVGRKQLDLYSNQINCGAVGAPSVLYSIKGPTLGLEPSTGFNQCDCLGLPDEKLKSINPGKSLKQNVLEDRAFHQVIDDNYRYDHLKFVLRPDRRIPSNLKPNCFPTGYDDGTFYFPIADRTARDLFDCRVDAASGALICGSGAAFSSQKGTAEFLDLFINGENSISKPDLVFDAGQPLKIDTTIRNIGQNKCIILKLDNQKKAEMVNQEGIQQYTILTDTITLGASTDISSNNPGIQIGKVNLGNQEEVSIVANFLDGNKDDAITLGSGPDTLSVDNGQPFTMDQIAQNTIKIGTGTDLIEISFENGQLTITKKGAKIVILLVEPQKNLIGGVTSKKDGAVFVTAVIRIPKQLPSTSQLPQQSAKRLTIDLVNTRDDTGFGDISSCNENDKVLAASGNPQQRVVTITIQQKATGTPAFRINPDLTPPVKKDTPNLNIITITSTVFLKDGIDNVQLKCKMPDGRDLSPVGGTPFATDKYRFDIPTSGLELAGKYDCDIAAKSKKGEEFSGKTTFEVQCGDKDNGYATCQDGCLSDKTISKGLLCYNQNADPDDVDKIQICCKP